MLKILRNTGCLCGFVCLYEDVYEDVQSSVTISHFNTDKEVHVLSIVNVVNLV